MTEFYTSRTSKTAPKFTSLLLSDFLLIFSFILSHPLYFSYLLFFSPYLLKLLSFLSPLFITTTLLLLILLRHHHNHHAPPDNNNNNNNNSVSESKFGVLLHNVLKKLQTKVADHDEEEDIHRLVELEAYRIVFETSVFEVKENLIEEDLGVSQEIEEKEVIKFPNPESNKVEEDKTKHISMESESNAIISTKVIDTIIDNVGAEYITKPESESVKASEISDNLRSFGSMRVEKEWKRTLACKLFEERHNVNGGEGGEEEMDSLWESYESDSSSSKAKQQEKPKKKMNYFNLKKGKKGGGVDYDDNDNDDDDDDDEDEDEDEDGGVVGQLCCLQALKFSTRKMNLGMGRPNLVKFSKALKGIGWLHHVSSKHGKKSSNN